MTDARFEQTIPAFVESLTNAGAITVAVMVSSVDGRAIVIGYAHPFPNFGGA